MCRSRKSQPPGFKDNTSFDPESESRGHLQSLALATGYDAHVTARIGYDFIQSP